MPPPQAAAGNADGLSLAATTVHRESAPSSEWAESTPVADDQSFLVRRARVIIFGDVSEHVFVDRQPDFAVTSPGSPDANHFAQICDFYADIHLDQKKEYRLRVGQSNLPSGWENLQSSQNRFPLERHNALNRAARGKSGAGRAGSNRRDGRSPSPPPA